MNYFFRAVALVVVLVVSPLQAVGRLKQLPAKDVAAPQDTPVVDVNKPLNKTGMTLLMRAVRHGETQKVEELIEQGADLYKVTSRGTSAFIFAAAAGELDALKTLLIWGDKKRLLQHKNKSGSDASVWAKRKGHDHIVTFLDRLKKTISPFPQSYFSPGVDAALVKFVADEQQSIDAALYRFTLYNVAQEMVKAKKDRNVRLDIVVDKHFKYDHCDGLKLLVDNQAQLYRANRRHKVQGWEIMHHKFIVFGRNGTHNKGLVWTGSFNLTGAANKNNWENVTVLDDQGEIDKFLQEMTRLKKGAHQLTAQECKYLGKKAKSKNSKLNNNIPV